MTPPGGGERPGGTRPRRLHRTPAGLGLVAAGGALGAAARKAVEQALPTARGGFPVATLVVNLSGALVLGLVLEALVRAGDDAGGRRRVRLLVGTGFLGAFTTYSTFALETDLLVRAGHAPTAVLYVAVTIAGGLVATVAGIAIGAGRGPASQAALPVDPDIDADGGLS